MEEKINAFEKSINSIVEKLSEELLSIRTNRPSPKLIDEIEVNAYGQMMKIKALGTVGVEMPRTIIISLWDKSIVEAVVGVLQASNLGMTPQIDGLVIRLTLPQMTEENRQKLEKVIRKTVEENRIRVRQERDDIMKQIKRSKEESEISENEEHALKSQIEKIVLKTNEEIEQLLEKKVKEIFE